MKKLGVCSVLLSLLFVFEAYAGINEDLIAAAKQGKTGEVQVLLLDKDIDVNATEKYGWTALLWAAANGHTDVVKQLIDKGADVNKKNELDWSALEYAKLNSHTEIVKLLKTHGAKE